MDEQKLHPVPRDALRSNSNPFSEIIPNLQVMWDSTSLGWLKRCPRFYQLRMLEGRETKVGSIHLTFGILYHSAIETYHKQKARGADHSTAQLAAVQYALENSVEHYTAWRCQNCNKVWPSDERDFCPGCMDDKPEDADFVGWRDLLTGLSQKGRRQLVRSVVWWTEAYQHDHLETVILSNGEAAVELSFTLPLDFGPADSDETYSLRGHLDRVGQNESGYWIPDLKTTKSQLYESYFDGFSPHNQVSVYTLAGKAITHLPTSGVIIDAAQMAESFTRFGRGYIHRTESQLEEFLQGLQYWLRMAEFFAKQDFWPQNEEACGLYGGCPYRHVCGRSPEVRQKYLENDYVYRPWNPAEDR